MAFLMLVDVSDLRSNLMAASCLRLNPLSPAMTRCVGSMVQTEENDGQHQWKPLEAIQVIGQVMGGRMGTPELTPVPNSPTEAFYRLTVLGTNGPSEVSGILSMAYVPNGFLGARGVTSVAFFKGCAAPPAQAAAFRDACGAVLESFSPDRGWSQRIAQRIINRYQQQWDIVMRAARNILQENASREQMITSLGQSMQQMQMQTYEIMRAANLRIGQDWIATFAGHVIMTDPATGQNVEVPAGFSSMGLDTRGPGAPVALPNATRVGETRGKYEATTILVPRQDEQ
jgi:hypothetical protein